MATNEIALTPKAKTALNAASLRARIGGYVVDMVVFGAVTMVLVVIAGFTLLASTDWAQDDASDPDLYAFLAIFGLGAPIAWTVLNLGLLAWRQQTAGQYVAGLRLTREDGAPLSLRDVLAWWFCLNPLLFSWPMAGVAGAPLAAVVALAWSRASFAVFGLVVLLCLAAPVTAFVSALLDDHNRALHDRVAGTVVVPAG